jgi:phage FluMu protein Com
MRNYHCEGCNRLIFRGTVKETVTVKCPCGTVNVLRKEARSERTERKGRRMLTSVVVEHPEERR